MTVLGSARVVTPDGGLDPGWVETTDRRITAVGTGEPPHDVDLDLGGQRLVPGFAITAIADDVDLDPYRVFRLAVPLEEIHAAHSNR